MKLIIALAIAAILIAGAASFFIWPRVKEKAPESSKGELIEAQRLLGLLKRIEDTGRFPESEEGFIEASATKKGGRFQYSDKWKQFGFPTVREDLGFNFRCSADGVCRAMELKGDIETGNGIGCDVESGEYQCYGDLIPVTTRGFDGAEIVVGCKTV